MVLHCHTEHSHLDGRSRSIELAEAAKAAGWDFCSITDHDEVGGHMDWSKACAKVGIKAIHGAEQRFLEFNTATSRENKTSGHDASHIILLAANQQGLSNLWALSSLAYEEENFYGKPQLNPDLMRTYAEGLYASDGCGLTRFADYAEKDDEERCRQEWGILMSIFGDRFYSELHTFQIIDPGPDDLALNRKLMKMNQMKVRLAQQYGVPLVVVNDAHYSQKHQWEEHRLVYNLSTQAWKKDQVETKGQAADWVMGTEEMSFYLQRHGIRTSTIEEALANTRAIGEACNTEIKPTLSMPRLYPTDAEDAAAFRRSIEEGFKRFVLDKGLPEEQYRTRLEYEASLIVDKNMAGYFNVVADYVMAARDGTWKQWVEPGAAPDPCLCGPGRGSAGGSLVNYVLGITSLDPIKYDLMFERFINPDRPDYPDIDVDFQKTKRHGVIGYIGKRYGEANVTAISTRSRSGPKAMLRDLWRALGYQDYKHFTEMTKIISQLDTFDFDTDPDDLIDEEGNALEPPTWDEILAEKGGELAFYAKEYPLLFKRLEAMVHLVRQPGVHAAGVLVNGDAPLLGLVPTRIKKGVRATQFDMNEIAELGGVKLDILSGRGLDVLAEARKLVYERDKTWLDYDGFGFGTPADAVEVVEFGDDQYADPVIWDQIHRGQTAGIFQIGTASGTKQAMRFKPWNLVDLANLASINRPGVIGAGQLDHFMARRHGEEEVTYDHPLMVPITGPESSMYTYGILVYQEQLIRTAREVAQFTPGEAEKLRKGIGKKVAEIIAELKPKFIDGAMANPEFTRQGGTLKVATKIWASLEAAGKYAFNKCVSSSTIIKLSGSSQHSNGTMVIGDMWSRLYDLAPVGGYEVGDPCRHCGNPSVAKSRQQCGACLAWRKKFRASHPKRGLKAWSLGEDGRLHPNRIVDVHQNGVQRVWKVVLADGKSITTTANHRHMTPQGWREVWELSIGDELLACGEYEGHVYTPREYRLTAEDNDGGWAALEAWSRTQEWACDEPDCIRSRVNGDRIERAHLDGDRTNNEPGNLAMKCVSHHKVYDYRKNGRRRRGEKGYPVIPSRIVSIEYVGEEMTYDLEMSDPHHSWVGNDVVTHNSHATGYAMQPCWETWTKHYQFDPFIVGCLSTFPDKIITFVQECRRRGRPVLPPDVNESGMHFTLTDEGIRFGLIDIRGIGEAVVPDIIAKRPYTDINDYLDRTTKSGGRKKGVVDALVKCGAFDALEHNPAFEAPGEVTFRSRLLEQVYWHRAGDEVAAKKWESLAYEERDKIVREKWSKKPQDYPKFDFLDEKSIIAIETELLGTHISVDPMARYANMIEAVCIRHPMDYDDYETNARFVVGGELTKVKTHMQKNNKQMAFLTIRWAEENFDVLAFADAYARVKPMLRLGSPVACEVLKLSGGGASLSTMERLDTI